MSQISKICEQVADLKLLKEETHKFESRYMDNLVGKLNIIYLFFIKPE